MPTVITNLSIGELFAAAIHNARKATAEIDRLMSTPLEPGETITDRALVTSAHARVLAEAFSIVDSLVQAEMPDEPCDCPSCAPRATREPGAPVPPHMN
jgi:hypothetical protein